MKKKPFTVKLKSFSAKRRGKDVLRVVLFKSDGVWIAQGLEHCFCEQGRTLKGLVERFAESIFRQDVVSYSYSQAWRDRKVASPKKFFRMFEDGVPVDSKQVNSFDFDHEISFSARQKKDTVPPPVPVEERDWDKFPSKLPYLDVRVGEYK